MPALILAADNSGQRLRPHHLHQIKNCSKTFPSFACLLPPLWYSQRDASPLIFLAVPTSWGSAKQLVSLDTPGDRSRHRPLLAFLFPDSSKPYSDSSKPLQLL